MDDIGAVLVIAAFYTANLKMMWLVIALVIFAGMVGMNKLGVDRIWPYVLVALALWVAVLFSGVHATIAGVMAALTVPMKRKDGHSLLEKLEHGLAPWSAYLVVPVFGFANAGVNFAGIGMDAVFAPLPLAIAAGLVVGKQVGIFGIIVAAVAGIARRLRTRTGSRSGA